MNTTQYSFYRHLRSDAFTTSDTLSCRLSRAGYAISLNSFTIPILYQNDPGLSSFFLRYLRYFCARSHHKVLFITQRSTYVLVQVFYTLSRGLFSLEPSLETRFGVVPSILELLIEALLNHYVLELGYRALHTVIGFQFNRYHSLLLFVCFFKPYTSIVPYVKSFVKCPHAQRCVVERCSLARFLYGAVCCTCMVGYVQRWAVPCSSY